MINEIEDWVKEHPKAVMFWATFISGWVVGFLCGVSL